MILPSERSLNPLSRLLIVARVTACPLLICEYRLQACFFVMMWIHPPELPSLSHSSDLCIFKQPLHERTEQIRAICPRRRREAVSTSKHAVLGYLPEVLHLYSVEVTEDTKIPNAATVKVVKQDHTLANMVRGCVCST